MREMTKNEFLGALRLKLSGLSESDIEEHISFYSEMIEDRIEDGASEEDAVCGIGSVENIAAQIIADVPLTKIAKERIKPKRRLRAWEIVLLAVGSPIWLSLGIAAAAVILSLYVVIWALIVSLWAVFASLVACALGLSVAGIAMIGGPSAFAGVIMASESHVFSGIALIGVGLVCAGLGIFLFFGCNAATKGAILLTKKIALGVKKAFMRKERE